LRDFASSQIDVCLSDQLGLPYESHPAVGFGLLFSNNFLQTGVLVSLRNPIQLYFQQTPQQQGQFSNQGTVGYGVNQQVQKMADPSASTSGITLAPESQAQADKPAPHPPQWCRKCCPEKYFKTPGEFKNHQKAFKEQLEVHRTCGKHTCKKCGDNKI